MTASKLLVTGALLCATSAHAGSARPPASFLLESFDDVSTLSATGWVLTNNSAPAGSTGWFQGNEAVFAASSGAANAYVAANFNNAAFGGAISNWLITPELALDSALTLTFDLRLLGEGFTDQVEVYLSSAGGSADVGASATSLGSFTQLLQSNAANSDTGWVAHALAIAAHAPGTSGRIGFRYLVADTSVNGNYAGLDSVVVSVVPEPASAALALLGLSLVGGAVLRRHRGHPG